jgi:hypothetical protein
VAVRKTNSRKKPETGQRAGGKNGGSRKIPGAVLFWLAFFILIAGLFWINRETIQKNYDRLVSRFSSQDQNPAAESPPPEGPPPVPSDSGPVESRPDPEPAPISPAAPPVRPPAAQNPQPPAQPPVPVTRPPESPPAAEPARDRTLYFTQLDKDGMLLRSKTSRKIPVSDSPMLDALKALLQGPTAAEQRRGLVSLIPPGSRILSATVRGSTAYISFSEEFQYNTYGVEGYAAQLKQIVWTATEFPNVRDVQILIEGRRVDYLGEGIWIGSPLGREGL